MTPVARRWQWLAAGAAPALATLACHALDGRMSVAGLAMGYLVAVVLTALTLDRGPGLLAALACVTALNFFFVPPRYSLAVDGPEYAWTLAVLLALSLALNGLIARLRQRTVRARLGEARSAQLQQLTAELAACQGAQAQAERAAGWLQAQLGGPAALFLREAPGAAARCVSAGAEPGAFQASAVDWAWTHGRALGRGCDDWPDLPLWCAPCAVADARAAVQVLLPAGPSPDPDTLRHWQAVAQQIGLALDRETAAATARSAQEAAQAEAARNTLLASLSHDLRTPLAAILGTASALRSQADAMPPRQRERLLENLENEARDMNLLADNILQMARLAQPQAQLALQWESMSEVLGAAVTRMRRRWPQARIELRVPPDLPPVRAEASLLAQLVANLVDNAVRHGHVEPHVVVRAGRARDGVFVAVRDHGAGLPPGDPQALFHRFADGTGEGTAGLGLALCELIARLHGGRIAARRCEPGAELRVDLPLARQEAVA